MPKVGMREGKPVKSAALEKRGVNGGTLAKGEKPVEPFDQLTAAEQVFVLAYLSNGFNASAAYRTAHPNVTVESSWVIAARKLRDVRVRAFLNTRLEEVWKPYQMGGEEALGRVAQLATGARFERVRLAALKVILEQTGKLRGVADSVDALAAAIRADKNEAKEKGF